MQQDCVYYLSKKNDHSDVIIILIAQNMVNECSSWISVDNSSN